MGYPAALAYLDRLPSREVKPGLERITSLLEGLGEPHRKLRAIHVGGTNGKGSVVAMLASVLQEAGYRVGAYTSPHLLDWRERVRIDGEWIPEQDFARLIDRLIPLVEGMEDRPTVFEVLTALAFQYFHDRDVDLAVVEVGLGGRFDATNVIEPLVAVITNVRRDHLDLLGPDMDHLAWEKAGIVKPGVPLVTGEQSPEILAIIAQESANRGAELRRAMRQAEQVEFTWEGQELHADGWGRLKLGLLGPYQLENLVVTLEALEALRPSLKLTRRAVRDGLAKARWPGRFQLLGQRPYIIVDGAHNPDGVRALLTGLKLYHDRYLPRGRRVLLFGAMRDKEVAAMGELLFPWFEELIFTKPDYYRAIEPRSLQELAAELGQPAQVVVPASEALRQARARLSPSDLLCVTGSLYLVGEILREGG
ncbi:MAG: bifunctional folylpolyglutamate synthase/dihydrofolate synthase [Candidatus Acetothermia bacterium]|jgi:dihydrofolate synthase/folylpolyglutamate synthase|nr:bifunctional folylpolyglutamate synthase/dihydrofolate synthase [Candidatus Acetothermia bacterium]MDH7504559.1 folylpolyglutamate synthase/dihydrofolate synthase family protein [Candidatus Acetothermia bacterium]